MAQTVASRPNLSRIQLPLVLFATATAVYGLDRVSKALVKRHLAGRPPAQLIPHLLQLNYTENSGGAFSLGQGQGWLFFGATVAVSVAIVAGSPRVRSATSAVALGLILGGALGNVTDRIVNGPGVSGHVIDFIDVGVWPVFNLADSAIVVGAGLLILGTMRRRA